MHALPVPHLKPKFSAVLLLKGAVLGCALFLLLTKANAPHQKPKPTFLNTQIVCPLDIWTAYHWLNPSELLLLQDDPESHESEAFKFSLMTGKRTPLPRLTAALKNSYIYHGDLKVSPDGKWILWHDENIGIRAATVNGDHLTQWEGDWHTDEIHWMPNSQAWLALKGAWLGDPFRFAVVHPLDKRQPKRKIAVNARILRTMNDCRQVGDDGCLYAWEIQDKSDQRHLRLTCYSLVPAVRPERSFDLVLPRTSLSPAVRIVTKEQCALVVLRFHPADKLDEIWKVNLADWQTVQKIKIPPPRQTYSRPDDYETYSLKTIGNSSRMSFVSGDMLWTVTR
jgi:hypothetical protein